MKLSTVLRTMVVSTSALILAFGAESISAKPSSCEICEQVLNGVHETLTKSDLKDVVKIESKFKEYCDAEARTQTQRKVCYYLMPIRRDISQPFQNGVPSDRICQRLKKKSSELCNVRESVKVNKDTDYTKLRVKQLKKILMDRGVQCENCLEKAEFVKRCKETEHLEL